MRINTKSIALITFLVLILAYCTQIQEEKIQLLEKNIEMLKSETVPLKFKIKDKTDSLIEVSVKFMDADNNEISKQEFNLTGSELAFDFFIVKIAERYIAFPYKLYSDEMAPDDGIFLPDFYKVKDFPQIFRSEANNEEFENGIAELFKTLYVDMYDYDQEVFGSMVHDIKQLREFKEGVVYEIISRSKGGIEIIME